MNMLVKCHTAGRKAFMNGMRLRDNPYALTSVKRKAWRHGYIGLGRV